MHLPDKASWKQNISVYFFAFWLTLLPFSTLFLMFLIMIYRILRAFLAIVGGFFLLLFIIVNNHQQLANTLGFLLIILGVFITAAPLLLLFYPKIKKEAMKLKEETFNSRLFTVEYYLIISFIILLFSYLIISNTGISLATLSLSSIRIILFILETGLIPLFGGLIILLETLTQVFLKI
jgi:hypothetical protein